MVHSKLSIIFILIASAIAPVVAPPPPATSHDVHGASSSHSPPPSSLSHPERQVRPLPKRSQADKGKAREVLLGSPNNPSIPGSSNNPIPISSSSSSSSQHSGDVHSDLEFEQGSSNLKTPGPSKKRKFDSQQVPSPEKKPRILTAEQKKRKSDYGKQKRREKREEIEKPEEKK